MSRAPILNDMAAIRDWYAATRGPLPAAPRMQPNESRWVDWIPVLDFVGPVLARHPGYPFLGTWAWRELPADDVHKVTAIFAAALHWVTAESLAQEASTAASKDIAGAYDWAAIGSSKRQRQEAIRSGAYIPRRAS